MWHLTKISRYFVDKVVRLQLNDKYRPGFIELKYCWWGNNSCKEPLRLCPQGSLLGLILINIFSNNLDENRLYVIKIQSTYKDWKRTISITHWMKWSRFKNRLPIFKMDRYWRSTKLSEMHIYFTLKFENFQLLKIQKKGGLCWKEAHAKKIWIFLFQQIIYFFSI